MRTRLIWDETQRAANPAKHGLDFADAPWVLDSVHRLGASGAEREIYHEWLESENERDEPIANGRRGARVAGGPAFRLGRRQ